MDGYTTARELRAWEQATRPDSPPTPVLALTAYSLGDARQRCIDAGCTDHLSKPIKKATLMETIVRLTAASLPADDPS